MRWLALVAVALAASCLAGPAPRPAASALTLVCGPPCDVDIDASEGAGAEPAAALNPTDPLHALVGSFTYEFASDGTRTRYWLRSHVTFDGGATWDSKPLPGGLEAGPTHPLATYSNGGDPDVMLLPGGKALFVGDLGTGTYPHLTRMDLFVARSDDGGRTWPRIDVIARGAGLYSALASNGPQHHIPFFARGDDGTIMLAWVVTNMPAAPDDAEDDSPIERDLVFSLSRDDGETWSSPQTAARRFLFGSSPAIAPDGSLHIAYFRLTAHSRAGDGTAKIPTDVWLTSSHDGGATWNDRRVAEGAVVASPSLAVAAAVPCRARLGADEPCSSSAPDGRLYLATSRADEPEPAPSTAPNRVTPILLWSDDAGETWSEPLVLDTPAAPGNPLPRVAVSPQGVAYVAYYHVVAEEEMEVRIAAFADGVLGPRLVLTKERIWPSVAQRDYLGLDADSKGAFVAWVGGRWPDTQIHAAAVSLAP